MPQRANTIEDFWLKVKQTDGCWLWLGGRRKTRAGIEYGRFQWHGRSVTAHRFAWEISRGRVLKPDQLACHHCDTPLCVRPDHIYAGTVATNAQDREQRGRRIMAGDDHGSSILTSDQVHDIRTAYATHGSGHRGRRGNITYGDLAQHYDVTVAAIGHVIRGERWH